MYEDTMRQLALVAPSCPLAGESLAPVQGSAPDRNAFCARVRLLLAPAALNHPAMGRDRG